VQRIKSLVNTMTGAHDKMVIEEYEHLVVRLPAGGYGTTEFDMSDERRNVLVGAGRNTMKVYLDAHPAPRAVSARGAKSKGAKAAPRGAKGAKGVKSAKTAADRIAVRLLRRKPTENKRSSTSTGRSLHEIGPVLVESHHSYFLPFLAVAASSLRRSADRFLASGL